MTFIEAWTDYPRYLPMNADDPWAQADDVRRLSTRIPGLGNAYGLIDPWSPSMKAAAANDPEVADFMRRAHHPAWSWVRELMKNHAAAAKGCEPPDESN